MADLCVPSDYGLPEMADLDHSYGSRHLEVARRPIRLLLRPGSRWRPLRPDGEQLMFLVPMIFVLLNLFVFSVHFGFVFRFVEEYLLPVEEKISASIHHSCLVGFTLLFFSCARLSQAKMILCVAGAC